MSSAPKNPLHVAISDLTRFSKVTQVLAKYGFFEVLERTKSFDVLKRTGLSKLIKRRADEAKAVDDPTTRAVRFRKVLEELGPTYVKLGQILSTRPDIMPRSFIEELENLQDQAPPLGFEQIEEQIETSLGKPLDELFYTIEEKPLASASIAQVHVAYTHDQQKVVVKVQRPRIREIIQADLDILNTLAYLLEATIEEVGLWSPVAIIDVFREAILAELDFTLEASNLEEFGHHLHNEPNLGVPEVFRDLTCPTVLTIEFIDGVNVGKIESGSARAKKLAECGLRAAYLQVFQYGCFHGDPHPGNILVTRDDRLIFIDLGLLGRLSSFQQEALVNLILTVILGDVDGIARIILKMGRPRGRINMTKFRQDIVTIRDRYIQLNLEEVDASAFLMDLLEAGQRHRIQVPPEYAILGKASVTMEGIVRHLYPDLDIISTARPYARQLIKQHYNARRLIQTAMRNVLAVSGFVQDVPHQLQQILSDIEGGDLSFTVQHEELDQFGRHMMILGTRVMLGVCAAAALLGAFIVFSSYRWELLGIPVMGVLGLLLALSLATMAVTWHFLPARLRKIRLTPLLTILKRLRRRP